MLTIDPKARLAIDRIKDHPAFRVGLASPNYILPTPLPMPRLPEPIDPSQVDQTVMEFLRACGYTDEGLIADFTAVGNTMAKSFYCKLTIGQSLDGLPWQEVGSPAPAGEDLMVSPQPLQFASPGQRMHSIGSPYVYSLAERPQWASFSPNQFKFDLVQPCVDIGMALDALMVKMQFVLMSLGFQWFHPDDRLLIGKAPEPSTYLVVRVHNVALETLQMDLYFTQATQAMVHAVMDAVRSALTSEELQSPRIE
jgi:hypothetical protein